MQIYIFNILILQKGHVIWNQMKRLDKFYALLLKLDCASFGGVGEITAASIGKATCNDPKA